MNHISQETLNPHQFAELQELLEDEFDELVRTYLADSLCRLQEIRTAFVNTDNATGFDAAHTLKGASANLGATRLTELCYRLQEACRNQQIGNQGELIENIADELNAVHQEVKIHIGDI